MRLILALTFLIGLGLIIYSTTLPYYSDPTIKDQLDIKDRVDKFLPTGTPNDLWKKMFYEKRDELQTNKKYIMDLGSGLAIASLTILIFLFVNKVKTLKKLKNLRTIKKSTVFILSNVAWLILIPGTFWYYSFRLGRDDYPSWADSIGIPIYQDLFVGAILILLLNIFIWLTSVKSNLPSKLFPHILSYDRKVIFWEIFFGFWLLINLLFLYHYIVDGDHIFIPVNLIFTYVLLVLRAGQIDKKINSEQNASG
jgi:uncharacterized membrane protein YccF (DUF307 family)